MSEESPAFNDHVRRALWVVAGACALGLGLAGIVLPVMPTVPFVLLAAFCFSRGCRRCERWLLEHRHFGPPLLAWREQRAMSRRAKQWATFSMTLGSAIAWSLLTGWPRWLPALACAAVAAWMWRLPEPRRP